MKKSILALAVAGFLVGCGGGSDESSPVQTSAENLEILSSVHSDIIIKKIDNTDFDGIIEDANTIFNDNYVAYYKRIDAMRFISVPDFNSTFYLEKDENLTESIQPDRLGKLIYKNIWSRKDEYHCYQGGTVTKEVDLFPRGHLEADIYKKGDQTIYAYTKCDMGRTTYNGSVEYSVEDRGLKIKTNTVVAGLFSVPLGEFKSKFNYFSMENEERKVTLNGAIEYKGTLRDKPFSLWQSYRTVGDFVVTIYDKSTAETTKLTYNGYLQIKSYSKADSDVSEGATKVDTIFGSYMMRETSSYRLRIEDGSKMLSLKIRDNIPSVINPDGKIEIRSVGYDSSKNTSEMQIGSDTILSTTLADGRTKYILDKNTDFKPDKTKTEGEAIYNPPLSDIDLMGGVIVIGFDTCPPTNALRRNLEELGVSYEYINIHESEEKLALMKWFNISGVPYVGINGSYFGAVFYSKDNAFAAILNLYGVDMNATVVDEAIRGDNNIYKSADVYYHERYRWLQEKKNPHTAMAVANDTAYGAVSYTAWGWSSAQKAKEYALEKCEERRKTRNKEGKKSKVYSKCRLYSVDGVILPQGNVQDIPKK